MSHLTDFFTEITSMSSMRRRPHSYVEPTEELHSLRIHKGNSTHSVLTQPRFHVGIYEDNARIMTEINSISGGWGLHTISFEATIWQLGVEDLRKSVLFSEDFSIRVSGPHVKQSTYPTQRHPFMYSLLELKEGNKPPALRLGIGDYTDPTTLYRKTRFAYESISYAMRISCPELTPPVLWGKAASDQDAWRDRVSELLLEHRLDA